MTPKQKIELRRSEIRERLAEIAGLEGDALTDEIKTEREGLLTEMQDSEAQLRAATAAEADTAPAETRHYTETADGESAELRGLIRDANLGNILAAAADKRSTDGREAELQQHYKLPAHQVPLALLRREVRQAATVTPGPTNTAAMQQPTVQPVFSEGDAAYLGVDMPMVGPGDSVHPVLTSRPNVAGPHTDSTAVAETIGDFDSEVLKPGRLQCAFSFRSTDMARFADLDASLRSALSEGLSEALDAKMVAQIVADVARTDADGVADFAKYRAGLVYDRVDGRFAAQESELRVLVGNATLTNMSGKYRGNTADDSAVDSVRRVSGGLRVSPHIPAVAGNKQDTIVRRGMRRDAVAATWDGVRIIFDELSKASSGEIVLNAVLHAAFKVLRTEGFARVEFQHV